MSSYERYKWLPRKGPSTQFVCNGQPSEISGPMVALSRGEKGVSSNIHVGITYVCTYMLGQTTCESVAGYLNNPPLRRVQNQCSVLFTLRTPHCCKLPLQPMT